ncbi:unnamed protein product [Hydatigera taeniaeformis]|uniref:Uncharacterized protein n=1 Tax=Hydatigena taeniaeformis TaxID=6205 RepID=A0A0R3WNJ4_HYDTA|nr:unnamed protein product [Hydatigera taeniaeformis]
MTTVAGQQGLSDISGNVEELRKSLPHVDLETGLKNRVVKRDPIAGLGDLPKEHCDFGKPKTSHQNKKSNVNHPVDLLPFFKVLRVAISTGLEGGKDFNKTLLSWDADTAALLPKSSQNSTKGDSKLARNPIALTGNLGEEVDSLRCTSRPRKSSTRGPQRDPISGKGDFGEREWDPIWKYNGRARRARSSTGSLQLIVTRSHECSNCASEILQYSDYSLQSSDWRKCKNIRNHNGGEAKRWFNTKDAAIEKSLFISFNCKSDILARNIITGENCANFDISQEMKPSGPRRRSGTNHYRFCLIDLW